MLFFLEFFNTCRVGTERNDNFYFLYFSAFSNLFWLEMKPQWYFFDFFCCFYGIFYYASGRKNGMIIFIFSLSQPFRTYFCWKWHHSSFVLFFLIYLIFLLLFLNFLVRIGSEWNETIIFIFSLWAFSILFWLEMTP